MSEETEKSQVNKKAKFSSFYDLIIARRSIRQFKSKPVQQELLVKIVNAGRLAPSAANLQPLEYIIVFNSKLNKKIFDCLNWANYLGDEGKPKPGYEPAAYIIGLINLSIKEKGYEYDVGASFENMILTALEEGVGSCWIRSINRKKLSQILEIPSNYIIDSVLALGYPDEEPIVEEVKHSIKYWKDQEDRLHVPKRRLIDIIHYNKF
ncbi:MAG: nitroreductase family protein [Candidatus Aminicenantia bacterium]